MPQYEEFEDQRIKHLELIQAVIGRLGSNSFYVKGWALTVVGAFLGFAVNLEKPAVALVALLPSVLFWALDAYFLRSERIFRCLYELVRTRSEKIEPFFMSATRDDFVDEAIQQVGNGVPNQLRVGLTLTLLLFYGALTAAAGATAIVV